MEATGQLLSSAATVSSRPDDEQDDDEIEAEEEKEEEEEEEEEGDDDAEEETDDNTEQEGGVCPAYGLTFGAQGLHKRRNGVTILFTPPGTLPYPTHHPHVYKLRCTLPKAVGHVT